MELRQQPFYLPISFLNFYYPKKGGLVSMNETANQKTTAPVVREYEIGGITYIVKAVTKDGAKEDAATKIRRLIRNDLQKARNRK